MVRSRAPSGQTDLFGEPPASPEPAVAGAREARGGPEVRDEDRHAPARRSAAGSGIGPAAIAAEVAALGAALPPALYLGTSSWSFPGWAGLVYDRPADASRLSREGLSAYARHPLLRAVGIDRTFYAPLSAAAFARHAAQVPAGFRFLVKAPAACTSVVLRSHDGPARMNDSFLDEALAWEQFVEPALSGLGDKAGPLVFQFSPLGRTWTRRPERFADAVHPFLAALRARAPAALLAIEVRDPEVLTDALFAALAETGVRYCVGVHARMPAVAEQVARGAALGPGPMVVRWNLHSGFGYDEAKARYEPFDRLVDEDPVARTALAQAAVASLAAGQPVYVIANNKAEGSAPLTLTRLAEAVLERQRSEPPPS